ncbi:ras domain containing protein [Aphelenchoides avenae]|nr:ras domain containing protein [Aphelenchus avenae]
MSAGGNRRTHGSTTYPFKIITLGSWATGKTSIIDRYVDGIFDATPKATYGIGSFSKDLSVYGASVTLDIWDTAGQERWNSLVKVYFKQARAAIIVFDITNRKSFEKTMEWIRAARTLGEYQNKIVLTLVGAKADLHEVREVRSEEAMNFARAQGIPYVETSAKNNAGIAQLFWDVAKRVLEAQQRGEFGETSTETIRVREETHERESECFC